MSVDLWGNLNGLDINPETAARMSAQQLSQQILTALRTAEVRAEETRRARLNQLTVGGWPVLEFLDENQAPLRRMLDQLLPASRES
ncbi:hypothetical protein [Carbonactinospora thermoautotrophica]|uniref:hypothetical protein n=1 Tax=Carbonactinospora thermoautotrophica TaxID=1469144 RepID=UPI000A40E36A|nr:hypothetical protein [Carbonactinospora thermoautotrophica]